jgi:hypothetical protein
MFVTVQDFIAPPYDLPNLDGHASFLNTADAEEKRALRKILGGLFYDALVAGMTVLPADWVNTAPYLVGGKVCYGSEIYQAVNNNTGSVPGTNGDWAVQPDDRWLKLREPAKYTDQDNKTRDWFGMKAAFVPYIHQWWITDGVDQVSGLGTSQSNAENATIVNPFRRICSSFNRYSDVIGDKCNKVDTLYGYLFFSGITFADIVTNEYGDIQKYLSENFKSPGRKNAFNL